MLSLERHERATDDLLIFEVEVDANCEDLKTREVKFAEKAKGQVRRAVKISLTGMKMGGYDQSDVRQAFLEASMKAISSIVNKLGNYYPVGGRITGLLGNRMTLNRGFEQGIGKDMQMVVYAPINGVDIPLAVAEASPADNTSNLVAWRWNMEDPYAKRIIAQMKEDFDWLQKHECYAVSLRLAVPPEWDREEDNLDRGTR